jgi:hypothetical protein
VKEGTAKAGTVKESMEGRKGKRGGTRKGNKRKGDGREEGRKEGGKKGTWKTGVGTAMQMFSAEA